MKFTKHEKEIIKKIASGEINDIVTYLNAFNLTSLRKLDEKEIEEKMRKQENGATYKTLSILKVYDDEVKVEVRIKRSDDKISITSYKIINALTNKEITNITDEDSLRSALGLKTSGEYEEILTISSLIPFTGVL